MREATILQIVFDLGGVIIDLHIDKTINAFTELSALNTQQLEQAYQKARFFEQYEIGELTDQEFRNHIRKTLKVDAEDEVIDQAWNAMLGTIPQERIEQVETLLQNYQCIVLSNTNHIHEMAFHQILQKQYGLSHLNELFDQVYFSHELGLRKPHQPIYHKVIDQSRIPAQQSVFMDDTLVNLPEAEAAGIHTLHIPRNEGFYEKLQNFLNN